MDRMNYVFDTISVSSGLTGTTTTATKIPPESYGPFTFKISNIDKAASAADLQDHFIQFNPLKIRILHSDVSKGIAMITFEKYPNLKDKFMSKTLRFQQISEFKDEIVTETYDIDETFEVDLVEIGTFINNGVIFTPIELKEYDLMCLVLNTGIRKIQVLLKKGTNLFKIEINNNNVASINMEHNDDVYHLTINTINTPKVFKGNHEYIEEYSLYSYTRDISMIWKRIISLESIEFGEFPVFRFKFSGDISDKWSKLASNYLSPDTDSLYSLPLTVIRSLPCVYVDLYKLKDFPFELHYQLLVLVSAGILKKYLVSAEFLNLLLKYDKNKVLQALEFMHNSAQPVYNPVKVFSTIIENFNFVVPQKLPNHCIFVRKIVITPTRVMFLPPTIELGNRVIRRYREYEDLFIRVSFTDENSQRTLDRVEEISDRISRFLCSGITVGERHYEFLAFSSSQLRDHSCWFFSPPDDKVTCESIRAWMGDFSHIHSVAKYAARLGQCFSSTTPIEITEEVEEIPDVIRNEFCFSDGAGIMPLELAKRISSELSLDIPASAFQVRYAGYKGVLTAYPSETIKFRPSMKKFVSESKDLEIVRYAQYSPAFLNHQIITLLCSMSVDDKVFLSLQDQMEEMLDDIFLDRQKASRLLSYGGDSLVLGILQKMISVGVSLNDEPFLNNLLKLFQCHKLKEVKYKARILVEDGAQLMGVLDEHKVLEYGQVFVQIRHPLTKELYIPQGRLIVSKMPAVHPGDVRVLTCVDRPELRHLENVIVFPQKGHRPHPNETSGSDLDGDIFFITWNTSLIPPVQNFHPMDYTALQPEYKEEVSIDDVKQFMVEFIANDSLGMIATSHKIHADLSALGVLSGKCIELAKLHSIAVDFPKSGIPAEFDPQKYKVNQYPDFLKSFGYPSTKVLGKLFRRAKTVAFHPSFRLRVDEKLVVNGYQAYIDEAIDVRECYEYDLKRLLTQHEIRSEFELVSQLVLDYSKNSRKEFELRKILNDVMKKIQQSYRKIFFKCEKEERWKKASAWYIATYSQEFNRSRKKMFSFPWIVCHDVLIEIYKKQAKLNIKEIKDDLYGTHIVSSDIPRSVPKRETSGDIGWIISSLGDLEEIIT